MVGTSYELYTVQWLTSVEFLHSFEFGGWETPKFGFDAEKF